MNNIIEIKNLRKDYSDGFKALSDINLNIRKGEIFALLGPNGAGKTTLINTICGIVNPTEGEIIVGGYNNISDYKKARSLIGLVPQELTTDAFVEVIDTVRFSRGLFGKPKNDKLINSMLRDLSLLDKKNNKIMTLSGGMKRRVMIAKALAHEPRILFLDEPTAGVDVQLRESMWNLVHRLKENGVTIILTTHYIEEAEKMADRIGVINKGKIIVVDEKDNLMKKLGKKELIIELIEPLPVIPDSLSSFYLKLKDNQLIYSFEEKHGENHRLSELLNLLHNNQVKFKDLKTMQTSLEDIFVTLVK